MTIEQVMRQEHGKAPIGPIYFKYRDRIKVDEPRAEQARHDAYSAIAGFMAAIAEAQTPAEALRIWHIIAPLASVFDSTERKALNRADELNK